MCVWERERERWFNRLHNLPSFEDCQSVVVRARTVISSEKKKRLCQTHSLILANFLKLMLGNTFMYNFNTIRT